MVETTNKKEIYKGKVVDLFVDELEIDGAKVRREVVRHRGGAAILAEKDGRFAFVRQYRHPMGEEIWEIPAGTRDENEPPETTALRELEEECGLVAKNLRLIGRFAVSPGYTDEILYIYFADEFDRGTVHLDDDEFLSFSWIEKEKAFEMAESGEIYDGKTLFALYKYKSGSINI